MTVQSSIAGQPGCRAALQVVNEEVSGDFQGQPVAVRRKAWSLYLPRYVDPRDYNPL
jgi:hypothetical protein